MYNVVILVCELDLGSSVIRWWIWSELLVSILMTSESRLHSHRYRLNWLATSHSLINLSGQLHTNDHTTHHSQSLKSSHHCSCHTIHCGRSIVYHWYISRSAIDNKKTRDSIAIEWQTRVPRHCSTLCLSRYFSLSPTPLQYRLWPYWLISSLLLCDCLGPRHEHKRVSSNTTIYIYILKQRGKN